MKTSITPRSSLVLDFHDFCKKHDLTDACLTDDSFRTGNDWGSSEILLRTSGDSVLIHETNTKWTPTRYRSPIERVEHENVKKARAARSTS